jgi:GrpB-like predicted nucleotidyltransferase (UPF0157 family)
MIKKIGLKRGSVKLSSYQKQWSIEFEKEKQRLLNKLGDLVVDIQHIGSTSVSGLKAKPIIDMSAGVRRFGDARKLKKRLRELGYNFDRTFQHQLFFAKGSDASRTHYLHVMRYKGVKWNNDALFRDYLRKHSYQIKKYSDLKTRLAKQYPDERQKYSDGKDKFIKNIIRLARREH